MQGELLYEGTCVAEEIRRVGSNLRVGVFTIEGREWGKSNPRAHMQLRHVGHPAPALRRETQEPAGMRRYILLRKAGTVA
jgi:hypothetical protein